MTEPIKAGARNNADDRRRIREMRGAAKRIADITVEMEPDDEDPQDGEACVKADFALRFPEAIAGAMVIKAAGDYELDVLLVPFGGPIAGKDTDGQYFDDRTDIQHEYYKTIPAYYYHAFTPEGKPQGDPEVIGKMTYDHTDAQGHWYKAILDRTNEYARRVWEAAKRGTARASSGSINHIARALKNGWIKLWPVVEGSLIDAEGKRQPANAYAVAMPAAKATKSENQPEAAAGVKATGAADTTKQPKGFLPMTPEELEALNKLMDERDARKAAATAEAEKAAEVETLRKENETMKAQIAAAQRLPGGAPLQRQFDALDKYDNLDAAETALVIDVLKTAGKPVSPDAIKALAMKVARLGKESGVSAETAAYAKGSLKAAGFGDLSDEAIKAATDPMYTGGSTIGSDWVGTAYSNQIWEALRNNANIVAKIPSVVIPDGYSSEYFPLEGADPTWYKVAEVTANDSTMKVPAGTVTVSQMATATKQISVAKMGARTDYSGELTEDSLIPFAAQLRMQLAKSGAEMMEHVVIDGDTATSSNINDIGGTTYSGAATTLFLLTNGFRKSCLVTTTAQSRSAAGGFVVEDFKKTGQMIGNLGMGFDPQNAAFIVDRNTAWAAAELPEAKDTQQTVLRVTDGFVNFAYGLPVIKSYQMHYRQASRLANTAGKVDLDTAGNNLYGAILGVHFPSWKVAYKRRMTMEVVRRAESDSWSIIALTRWGLGQRDVYASAITYYVGV